MKRLATGLGLAALMGATGVAIAANALFDEGHGQRWPMSSHEHFETARSALTLAGHTITVLDAPITAAALSGHDIFVTGTLDMSYTAAEIEALQDFVASGGSVLVNHDGGWDSYFATPSVNAFLAPYGMALAGSSSYVDGLTVEDFVTHCVTQDVVKLGLDFVRVLVTIDPPAEDLTIGTTEILAVYASPASGLVVVLPDDTLWTDPEAGTDYCIEDFDNLKVLLNIFDCVVSVSTEVCSWTTVKQLWR